MPTIDNKVLALCGHVFLNMTIFKLPNYCQTHLLELHLSDIVRNFKKTPKLRLTRFSLKARTGVQTFKFNQGSFTHFLVRNKIKRMWKRHLDKKNLTVYKYEKIMKQEKDRKAHLKKVVAENAKLKEELEKL